MIDMIWAGAIMMYSTRTLSTQISKDHVSLHDFAGVVYAASEGYVTNSVLAISPVAVPQEMATLENWVPEVVIVIAAVYLLLSKLLARMVNKIFKSTLWGVLKLDWHSIHDQDEVGIMEGSNKSRNNCTHLLWSFFFNCMQILLGLVCNQAVPMPALLYKSGDTPAFCFQVFISNSCERLQVKTTTALIVIETPCSLYLKIHSRIASINGSSWWFVPGWSVLRIFGL